MKRIAIIIGIALVLWGLYKISSAPPAATPIQSENTTGPENEKSATEKPEGSTQTTQAPTIVEVPTETPGVKTATAPTETVPTIDPQKKAELLKKQSVFKGETK